MAALAADPDAAAAAAAAAAAPVSEQEATAVARAAETGWPVFAARVGAPMQDEVPRVSREMEALRAVDLAAAAADGWSPDPVAVFDEDGTHAVIHRRVVGDGFYEYRVVASTPFPAETLVRAQYTPAYRAASDEYCAAMDSIASLGGGLQVVTWEAAWPFGFSNRDYVFWGRTARCSRKQGGGVDSDCFVHIARSCSEEEMVRFRRPPDEGMFGCVRVNCFFSNTKVIATGANSCDIVFHSFDNPGGALPEFILDFAISTAFPTFMRNLRLTCEGYAAWAEQHPKLAESFKCGSFTEFKFPVE